MCQECGCGAVAPAPDREEDHPRRHSHAHLHDPGRGDPDGHSHDHPHGHSHANLHGHAHGQPHPGADATAGAHPGEPTRNISLETSVLARNDALAAENRAWLRARGVKSINLISSPGSGKTRLLAETLTRLRGRIPCAVIVGDVQTDNDARRLQGLGAPAHQIETRNACHLDAGRIQGILDHAVPPGTRLLFIENVGNLVCPAAFDLGESVIVALLSVTEGEDKPLKYPALFHRAPVVLLTKTDLAPHLEWDRALCLDNIRRVRPGARIIELSAATGAGMAGWIGYLDGLAS